MGAYDEYGNAQIKLAMGSEPQCYKIGDKVPLEDGVYLDYGTVIVIKDGVFVAEFDELRSKWGDRIDSGGVIAALSPISQAIEEEFGDQLKK